MAIPESVRTLERDLIHVFGRRLRSLVLLAGRGPAGTTPTLVVVERIDTADLDACAALAGAWHDAGLATPIVWPTDEFTASLDAFPLEFSDMAAGHVVVSGADVFDGLRVDPADLRLACERQARSHLLHLRQGYLETRGRGDALAELVVRSAAPLAALVRNVARLQQTEDADPVAAATRVEHACGAQIGALGAVVRLAPGGTLQSDEARRIVGPYLEALTHLSRALDGWSAA